MDSETNLSDEALITIAKCQVRGYGALVAFFVTVCSFIPDDYKDQNTKVAFMAGFRAWRQKGGSHEDFQN